MHQQYIGRTTQVVFSVVEAKIVTPRDKHVEILVCFLQENLTMVSLFQNMRSLVSCPHICAPNYVEAQLSIEVING